MNQILKNSKAESRIENNMNITFTSEINNGTDKTEKIQFTAPLNTRIENNMRVFEFEEPQNKVMNWIEIGENNVNIISGPTTINLVLDTDIHIEYPTPAGTIHFTSKMSELEQSDDKVTFKYSLSQGQKVFGEFKITLEIN